MSGRRLLLAAGGTGGHIFPARALADESGRVQLVDVRNPGETVGGALPGAVNVPLASLLDRIDDLDPTIPTVVYCAGGYRSSVAASLLRSRGFTDVADILGGYDAVAASAAV